MFLAKFQPFDIVRVVAGSGERLGVITHIDINDAMGGGKYAQYCIKPLRKTDRGKVAWYQNEELELVANIFEVIAQAGNDDRCGPSKFKIPRGE